VRSIEGVDEWVDSGAVGTSWNTVDKVSGVGIVVLWGKVGSISVELEVTVSGVVRVDEWVEVRINWCINIVVVNCLNDRSCLLYRSSKLLYRGSTDRSRGLGNKSSGLLTSSSGRNMSSF